MDKEKLVQAILNHAPLSRDLAEQIAAQFHDVKFNKGEIILKKGEVSDAYYFLVSGVIRSYLFDTEGKEVSMDFYTENNFAFEVGSFFTRKPSEVNMEAVIECKTLVINFTNLNTLFHEQPAFRELGRAILVKAFINTKHRNYAMINRTAEERYMELLEQQPLILKHAPLKQIASYLGITDSTLSRIRAKI